VHGVGPFRESGSWSFVTYKRRLQVNRGWRFHATGRGYKVAFTTA
jgi:hypothetical protein